MITTGREIGRGADIVLQGVSKRYLGDGTAVTALDDVTLAINASSAVAVTGPSGSGKSTLLHVVGAMDVPDNGTVRVGGVEVSALTRREQPAYRRTVGFVFQRYHLLAALSALDNVAAPLLPYKTDFDRFERARELLDAVGLGDRPEALPSRLSGGQQQRVAIARALVNDPRLLLADEPTGNLDSATSDEIMQLLVDLRTQRGMTVVVATHDPLVASRCERVVRLQDGRIVDDAEVSPVKGDELLARISRLDAS